MRLLPLVHRWSRRGEDPPWWGDEKAGMRGAVPGMQPNATKCNLNASQCNHLQHPCNTLQAPETVLSALPSCTYRDTPRRQCNICEITRPFPPSRSVPTPAPHATYATNAPIPTPATCCTPFYPPSHFAFAIWHFALRHDLEHLPLRCFVARMPSFPQSAIRSPLFPGVIHNRSEPAHLLPHS